MFPRNHWLTTINTPAYHAWAGNSFEIICQKHANQILDNLKISGMGVQIAAWRGAKDDVKAQVDLLFSRQDRIINLCEIKYTREPLILSKKLLEEIDRKVAAFKFITKTNRTVMPILISASGVNKILQKTQQVGSDHIKVVTAEALF